MHIANDQAYINQANKIKISAIIITYNEEDRLHNCLNSIIWADEIIIIDSFSTDRTLEIAKKYTTNIYQRNWQTYANQKNFALSVARNNWILFLDADEQISQKLAIEIKQLFNYEPSANGFIIPRKSFYLGRWIKHGEWADDLKLRLVRKQHAIWSQEKSVHEELCLLEGDSATLQGEILHFTNRGIKHHLRKCNLYSTLFANDAYKQARIPGLSDIVAKPFARFVNAYIKKKGFRDGAAGFIIAVIQSIEVFLRYLKLGLLNAGLKKLRN